MGEGCDRRREGQRDEIRWLAGDGFGYNGGYEKGCMEKIRQLSTVIAFTKIYKRVDTTFEVQRSSGSMRFEYKCFFEV